MKKTNNTKLLGVLLAAVLLIAMICTFVLMAGAQEGDACRSTANCTGTYENGICTQCDAYEPATVNTEGYYEISNAGQLYGFAAQVNGGHVDINGILTEDIVINEDVLGADGTLNGDGSGFRAWTPIGDNNNQYAGTFDGDGHTVSGLYFNNPEQDDVGLFGYTASDATVQNVGVIDSYFNGYWSVGGVVGSNFGNVENCYNTGMVSSNFDVGGVVGTNNGTVQSSHNTGMVSGELDVGGVVGLHLTGTVQDSYNTGEVSGTSNVGGVVGENENNGVVQNSYNTGTVSGTSNVGGVVGYNDAGTVQRSYNTGTVSGTSDVGGVVGKNEIDSVVESCYYLSDSETDALDGTTAKTAAQFASCEVCEGVGFHVFDDNGLCLVGNGGFEQPERNVDGTYLIQTPGNLLWYAQAFNAELLEPYSAMLTADIEIPEGMVWTPIGSYDNPYCLTFDGQGYTISGLTVQDGRYVGLFGAANEHATVRNLGVVNSTIAGTDFAGGIVGYNRGVVDNVYVYEVSVSGSGYAGGIAGYHAGNLTDSFAVATVTGAENTGITVGYNAGTTEDVYAFESVEDKELLSGKLAVLLGEGWYQQLGGTGDAHPVLRGTAHVHYYVQDGAVCTSDYFVYTNHDQEDGTLLHNQAAEHDENGFCANVHCGGYEQPAQNADGYYEIDNAGKLYWFMEHVNAGNAAASAILTKDIVVNKGVLNALDKLLGSILFREWTPIGNANNPYAGTFDGDGHTISGLYFSNPEQDDVGLFGYTASDATVQNVGVIDSYFDGKDYVGGVVGYHLGTVENCYYEGSVSGNSNVGGVVGYNHDTIKNCYNEGSVSGNSNVGGVVGYNINGGTVENCYYLDTCGAAGEGTSVNAERFASGEIAFLLGDAFGQKLGSDSYPVLINSENTNKVYRKGDCATGTVTYSNDPAQSSPVEHTITEESNGFCEVCGGYQAATLTTDKYDLDDDGQYDRVYEISNAGQLYWFAGLVNGTLTDGTAQNTSANAILTADIVVNEGVLAEMAKDEPNTEGFRAWTPIGVHTVLPYYGIFDGDGHTVSGLYDHRPDDFYSGLFGCIETDAIVQNVGVKDSYFYASGDVGGVVGYNYGTVQNCYNVGGVSGTDYVGGIVGYNYGTVQNCYNVGDVSGTNYVGGVVGCNDGGTVQNCYNTGLVSGTDYVGGVVGYASNGIVENCYNVGDVSGNVLVGGVIGYNYGTVQNCYYLTGTASGGMDGADAAGQAEAKSAAQFASGEVAYLLNGGKTDGSQVWYQTLGEQSSPTLDSEQETVYLGGTCTDLQYSNDATVTHDESVAFENGFCPNCNVYEQPDTVEIEGVTYYAIDNAGKLYWFMEYVNAGNRTANAVLTANIVVNEDVLGADGSLNGDGSTFRAWTPIGNTNNQYAGTFDGDGHTISGLYFNDTSVDYVGLFGFTASDATVQNVGVIASYFQADAYVGGVVGYNGGNVENCYNTGAVSGDAYVGGVVGYNSGTVENCYNTGTISGARPVGGVVGNNDAYGTVQNCYNTGSVKGSGYFTGGVIGMNIGGTAENCYNTGSVNGSESVGGVVGYNYYGGITKNCYNTGSVSGESRVGGVVGENDGSTVENCYNTGSVSGSEYYVGGVVGFNYSNSTVENCYNTGSVSGGRFVGGVVGDNGSSTVENCYYLTGTASGGINGADAAGQAEAKSAAQFTSGEVAYLLNGDQTEIVFGQTLGKDDAPTLGGKQVYELDPTCNADQVKAYSNVYLESFEHAFVNGFCTECDAFQPAVYNEEKGYYEISNAGQLFWFAGLVNGTLTDGTAQNTSANAVLTADIVVNEGTMTAETTDARAWTPIGTAANGYNGIFDGNGKTVSGLYFNGQGEDCVGLFGYVGTNGKVQNVGVIDSYFRGFSNVGGVVGRNYGTVANCYNRGSVTGGNDTSWLGGVVGRNNGTVTGCYNTGAVHGQEDVGGVVGENSGTVQNCYNLGEVGGYASVGGVVGDNQSTVSNCYNASNVIAKSNGNSTTIAGGVVGINPDGTVTNSYYNKDMFADDAIGEYGTSENVEGKTTTQFESGEVAYLLGEGFGQEIGKDQLPVLGGTQVYAYTGGTCSAPDTRYTNDARLSGQEHYEHNKITGFVTNEEDKLVCSVCGREAVAEVVDDFGEKYHFIDLKTALEYAADSGRGYVVLLCDVTEDVQISEYDELVLDLNGYALAEGITLTLGEGSILTLTNGKVYADMTGQQTSLLILGENVRVYGEIHTEGNLELGAPVMGDIDITKVGNIRESNGYQLTVNDLAALQLGLTEGDVIAVDENGNVYYGEIKIELAETEGAYTGRAHPISVGVVGIGNASVYNAIAYYDGSIIDIGEYELEIKLSNMRLVYAVDGSDTLTATYTVTKGQLDVNHGPYASHPFGTDRTTANVRGEMFLLGAAEYTAVPGTFGAITQNEAGGYEVVFTPDDTDTYEITTVTLEDVHFATEAVLPENVTVIVPDWVGIGEHVTLDHTAVNPHSGEKIANVTYEYYVGELHDSVQWNAIPGNQFTPSASVGNQIYIRVVVPNVDGQYHAAVSEPVLVTVVNVADRVADLEQAVDELGDAVASGEASIADINQAMQAVQQRLDALESMEPPEVDLSAVNEAIAALEAAVAAINAKLEGVDLAQIATNKNDIASLSATVSDMQQTLAALGEKDSELAAAIEQTNASLATLQSDLSALAQRVTANEQAIADLGQAIDALDALVAAKADASEIAEEIAQINARLAALEEIEIPSLDAVNARIEQLDAAIKAIDLSGIEANAAAIEAMNATIATLQQTLTALGNKDAELAASIATVNQSIATLQSELSALEERVSAAEQAIADLEAEILNLQALLGKKADAETVNAALAQVNQKLAALEAVNAATRLDAAEKAIAALQDTVKSMDLSGIEANKAAIAALNETVSSMQATVEKLATKAELNETAGKLSATLQTLSGELDALEARLANAEKAIEELNAEIANLQALLGKKADAETVNATLAQVNQKLAALEAVNTAARLDAAEKAIAALQDTVKSMDLSGIEANKADIAALQATVAAMQTTVKGLATKAELTEAVAGVEAELNALSGDLEKTEARLDALDTAIETLEAEIDALSGAMAGGSFEELQKEIDKINAALIKIREFEESLNYELMFEQLGELEHEFLDLSDRLEATERQNSQDKKELKALGESIKALQATVETMRADHAEMQAAIDGLNQSLSTLSGDITAIHARLDAIDTAIETLETEMQKLTEAVESGEIEQMQKQLDAVNETLAAILALNAESRLSTLENGLTGITETVNALSKQLGAVSEQANANKQQFEALVQSVEALQSTVTALAQKDQELAKELAELHTELATLSGQLQGIEQMIEALQAKDAELASKDEELESKYNELAGQLAELQAASEQQEGCGSVISIAALVFALAAGFAVFRKKED